MTVLNDICAWMLRCSVIRCMFCCQLISGLHENSGVLLFVLDNAVDCVHNGHNANQFVLHGLSQWLLSHSLVWSRLAAEADQIALKTVRCL